MFVFLSNVRAHGSSGRKFMSEDFESTPSAMDFVNDDEVPQTPTMPYVSPERKRLLQKPESNNMFHFCCNQL